MDKMCNFKEWVEDSVTNQFLFGIPNYQRAYSWNTEQAKTLLDDLINSDEYFLGLFLLEIEDRTYWLIDGQQRLATIFMLLSAIYSIETNVLANTEHANTVKSFLFYDDNVLRLSLQEEQNEQFKHIISRTPDKQKYYKKKQSQESLKEVLLYFDQRLNELSAQTIQRIVATILNSKVLLHTVDNTGQAMKVFELLNDRGKPLTQIESLKCFIMHQVHLKSGDDEHVRRSHLDTVKGYFSKIYKILNDISSISKRNLHEDDILRYYFIAFEKWSDTKELHKTKENLKEVFNNLESVEALLNRTKMICDAFQLVYQIIEKAYGKGNLWVKNLYVLDRMATFYPLLMAIENKFPTEPKVLNTICNYLELYTFRAFGIMNKRTSTGARWFYNLANDINSDDKISSTEIYQKLKEKIYSNTVMTNDVEFELHLNSSSFYSDQQGIDVRYFLIKYENYLQHQEQEKNKRGYELRFISEIEKIINFESKTKESFTVEHIVAQNLVTDLDYIRNITMGPRLAEEQVTTHWHDQGFKNYKRKYFEDYFLHSLGNLVISQHGSNAGKSDYVPKEKEWSSFKSQEEIKTMIQLNLNRRKHNSWRREFPFTVDEILSRRDKMLDFALSYWSTEYLTDQNPLDITKRNPLI